MKSKQELDILQYFSLRVYYLHKYINSIWHQNIEAFPLTILIVNPTFKTFNKYIITTK
jgi:hypothetical protein